MSRYKIAIISLLDHPNFMKFYSFRNLKNEYIIEIEFIDGNNLKKLVN
jgi:hypothetical protein